jgi:hypothetical protein
MTNLNKITKEDNRVVFSLCVEDIKHVANDKGLKLSEDDIEYAISKIEKIDFNWYDEINDILGYIG